MTIALATMRDLPQLHESDHLLVAALAEHGIDAVPAVWDDPAVDWAGFAMVLLRSTWDYATRREEFVAWARRVAELTRLENPPSVIEWNLDKRYLLDLERAGVGIVPSTIVEIGDDIDACPHLGVTHVVKPIVGAGGLDSVRIAAGDTDLTRRQVSHIHETGRAALIQPFVSSADTRGEHDLICYDSRESHTMHKPQVLPPIGVPLTGKIQVPVATPTEATDHERRVAQRALEAGAVACGVDSLLYGRVDMVLHEGEPVIMELELLEPHMYFTEVPDAAPRYAEHIARRLG